MPSTTIASLLPLLHVVFSNLCIQNVHGHALMIYPKPRNLHAYENRHIGSYSEATVLNNNIYQTSFRSNSVCGQAQNGGANGTNYDNYVSGVQATYLPGQIINVFVEVIAFRFGHFEFSICPAGPTRTPTQDCFRANKLRVVRDVKYNAPLDPNYPERAMIPPEGFGKKYSYDVALPTALTPGPYVLKWMYVSADSCVPEGYNRYPFPSSWDPMYTNESAICGQYDLATPLAEPEIFINCAEVAIYGDDTPSPSIPNPTPMVPAPAPVDVTPIASISNPFCGGGRVGNGICAEGFCCSPLGHCGCTSGHCTHGQTCNSVGTLTARPFTTKGTPVPASATSNPKRKNSNLRRAV